MGENGALAHREGLLLLVVDHGADDVGRQQVGRELDAAEVHVHCPAQGLDGEGFGQSRDALEEDVAIGEEAGQEGVDHALLSDDDLADFMPQRVHEGAGCDDAFGQGLNVRMAMSGRGGGGSKGLTVHVFWCRKRCG